MTNPTYYVNISFVPKQMNGQQALMIAGVTQSVPTYAGEYFVASMPEIKVSATGSSYSDALTNLLSAVTPISDPGNGALSNIRFY